MAGGELTFINWIKDNIQPGRKGVLELGSGHASTKMLSEAGYKMMSIEHDKKYVGMYESIYIHAPLGENSWYNVDTLKKYLPQLEYDVILVDGPVGVGNNSRLGFFVNVDLFDTSVPILIHDAERPAESQLAERLSNHLNRPIQILNNSIPFGHTVLV